MNQIKKLAVILAAGKGSRMDSSVPKPINKVCNKPIISWLIDSFKACNIDVVLVINKKDESFFKEYKDCVNFVYQNIPLGTGDAAIKASSIIKKYDFTYIFVGDSPFVDSNLINQIYSTHKSTDSDCTILSAIFEAKKFPYARIIRKNNKIVKIVEERDASKEELLSNELFCSHYFFKSDVLLNYIEFLKPNDKTREIYLTDILNELLGDNKSINSLLIKDWKKLVGLNTKEDILWAESQNLN